MKSHMIGSLALEKNLLNKELDIIQYFPASRSYQEYIIGAWWSCMIWNKTGDFRDDVSEEYSDSAKPTQLGSQLEYINSLLNHFFCMEKCKSVRIFAAKPNGFLIPHKDYLELDHGFKRIHVPLLTDEQCLTSEDDIVFNMREGEIWFLDGNEVHAAGCFSSNLKERLHLVLDFEANLGFSDLLKESVSHKFPAPNIKERPPLRQEYLDSLYGLSDIVNEENFSDIVSILAKVHFFHKTKASYVYDWLIDITKASGIPSLLNKAIEMRRALIETGPMISND